MTGNGRRRIGLLIAAVMVAGWVARCCYRQSVDAADRRRLDDLLATIPRLDAEAVAMEVKYGAINHPMPMAYRETRIAPLSREARRIADRHPLWPDAVPYRTAAK